MTLISKLLRKNISPARIIGFILSNFLGLTIVLSGLQFFLDARSIWTADDSFIRSDYIVINKRVTSENTLRQNVGNFSSEDISELAEQPWVKRFAPFTSAGYRISASLSQGGRGISTHMFFEAIPNEFVDVPSSQWSWKEGEEDLPLIISKDYLTLYNFGFASSAGLPQISEGLMSGIPLTLNLSSEDGSRTMTLHGHIAGYSNRLNTILVPQEFMDWSNARLGAYYTNHKSDIQRIIIEVSSPGDVAIRQYIDSHDLEIAGDKSASSASFLLKVVVGVVLAIGIVITLLSFFILLLSISLLMEKNRDKLHSLIMLGYPLNVVGTPYRMIILIASIFSFAAALCALLLMRSYYLESIIGLGAEPSSMIPVLIIGAGLTVIIIIFNNLAVGRKIRSAFHS